MSWRPAKARRSFAVGLPHEAMAPRLAMGADWRFRVGRQQTGWSNEKLPEQLPERAVPTSLLTN
jgi:hypothetical protein